MNKPLVVVLGGSGFLGRHLAQMLVQAGYRVRIPSRNRNVAMKAAAIPGADLISANVHDPDQLAKLLRGASVAINLVGILNENGDNGRGFQTAHVELVEKLIGACKKAGVKRLLQMSSLNAGRGSSYYLKSRGEAEQKVKDSGLDWTIFQPSVIFGRGDSLFNRFAALLKIAPIMPLAKAGSKFAPVYVGDVARAMVLALGDKSSIGQSYELYGDRTMTLEEIVRYTAEQLGLKRLIWRLPDALGRLQALAMDFVPGKPFSSDNYRSLSLDSVGGVDGLFKLGVKKTPVEAIVPLMLGSCGRQALLDRGRQVR
ncbi:complex I NDUFA9 subunit family protein [Pseudomarimonas arenosa]|uniref:Complex I NDUFA9 subunit family protein n=1 Tax=Pseudomarimonas arenosa TaxID=2774145 RepID=A0AAW3ZKH4_9GAMM|nr:complex I NDUFA9 subunit family protein [Pseudomarimonas arenosa]MBD8525699.1 complex I NDUFA9 subunit family protein [Pseudomarimonas arenosa]